MLLYFVQTFYSQPQIQLVSLCQAIIGVLVIAC